MGTPIHGHERQSALMSKITNDDLTRSVWHRMLYSCTHMATVGVKGLNRSLLTGVDTVQCIRTRRPSTQWFDLRRYVHTYNRRANQCSFVFYVVYVWYLADRTNGRAYATVLRLSVVCNVKYCD